MLTNLIFGNICSCLNLLTGLPFISPSSTHTCSHRMYCHKSKISTSFYIGCPINTHIYIICPCSLFFAVDCKPFLIFPHIPDSFNFPFAFLTNCSHALLLLLKMPWPSEASSFLEALYLLQTLIYQLFCFDLSQKDVKHLGHMRVTAGWSSNTAFALSRSFFTSRWGDLISFLSLASHCPSP